MASAQKTVEKSSAPGKCVDCGVACCPISLNDEPRCTECAKKAQPEQSSVASKKSPSKGLDLQNPVPQASVVTGSQGTGGSLSNLSVTSPTDQSRPGSGASMVVNPAESTMSEITDRSLEASSSAGTPLSGPTSTAEDLPTDQTTPDDSSADSSSTNPKPPSK